MDAKMTAVTLTDEELVLLDGRVSLDAQKIVDAAKGRIAARGQFSDLDSRFAGFIADVLAAAEREGKLIWIWEQIRSCPVCGKRPDPRYVLYKSGPNRGTPNYDKPRYLQGVELLPAFVKFQGSVLLGACTECMDAVKPHLEKVLAETPVQLPPQLLTDGSRQWVKRANMHCTVCGWEGHEGQMRQLPTLIGYGSYPGGCPDCSAENHLGGLQIKTVDGFQMVEVKRQGAER